MTWPAVHFSDLKKFALSAAHFRASCEQKIEATRAMRVGTIVHHIVCGPHNARPLVCFDGWERKGNAWKVFEDEHKGKVIVTAAEWADAKPIADAVLSDPVAMKLLANTRREVALKWEDAGIECETDGIDFVGDGYIGDLKTTTCTEPRAFARHAFKLLYHAQIAWLETGAQKNKIDTSKGLFLIGVETDPPHAVTCMRLVPDAIELGRRSYSLWLEKLRTARENDHWPAYAQGVVDFELPAWVGEGDDDE